MSTVITTPANVYTRNAFDVTDFPACKMFFPCNESSGTTITCSVTGVTATHANWSVDGTKLTSGSGAANQGTMTGTMPSLGTTGMPLVLAVFDMDAVAEQVAFGDTAGVYMDLVHTLGARVDDNTSATSTAGIDNNSEAAAGYISDRAGTPTLRLIETDGTAAAEASNTTATVPANEIDLSGTPIAISGTGTVVYGMAAFHFTADRPQNDLVAAMSWCNYHWRNGNMVLPPWWRNVA